jgi:outer membrane immunogenic protein
MRRVSVALVCAVSVVAFTNIASAADLYQPAYKSPPPPPMLAPVQDWSGVYVGIEGGYGWGHERFDQAFDPFFLSNPVLAPLPSLRAPVDLAGPDLVVHDPTISSVHQSGWLGGGFGGVQKQWGSWVLGLEAGIDGADIKGSTTATNSQTCVSCRIVVPVSEPAALLVIDRPNIKIDQSQTINSKIDLLGFAGPKIGWAFSPSWMIYGTGGLAWAHLEANASQNQTVQRCDSTGTNCIPFTFDSGSSFDFSRTQSGGLTMFGWAAGAGIDWKYQIDPGSAMILGVKYLHYGFGNNTLTLADNQFGSGASFAINTKESVDVVTGRISYLFSIH